MFLTPPALKEPQFLDARQQETLVWGIGRFIADEPTRRLDLAATVQATARAGGTPALHYETAAYQREVWLWVDDAAEDSALARLADEVEATLQAHGLAVERALFRGIPERLLTATGRGRRSTRSGRAPRGGAGGGADGWPSAVAAVYRRHPAGADRGALA